MTAFVFPLLLIFPRNPFLSFKLTAYIPAISFLLIFLMVTYMQSILKSISSPQTILQLLDYPNAYRTPPAGRNL